MSNSQDDPSTSSPACYVIVYNVAKRHNIGTLVRSCTAFGVKEVSDHSHSSQHAACMRALC